MSDSYIPYAGLAQPASPPANVVSAFQHGQEFGLEYGRQRAALNALQGVDITNPDSVNRAANALVGLNMADQAKATTDLAFNRALQQPAIPVFQAGYAQALRGMTSDQDAQGSAPSPQAAPAGGDPASQLNSFTAELKAVSDPAQREALFDSRADEWRGAGVPQAAIDSVKSHLIDQNFSNESLDQLLDHYQAHTAGPQAGDQGVQLPAGPQPNRAQALAAPGVARATRELNGPLANAGVAGVLAGGPVPIDVNPGLNRDVALTSGVRQGETAVAYNAPEAYQTGVGSNVGAGTVPPPPAPGAQLVYDANRRPVGWQLMGGALQAIEQTSQAGAQGPASVTGAPPGGRVTGASANPLSPTGVEPTPGYVPTTTGVLGATTGAGAAANANVAAATAFEGRAGDVPTRKANLANLRQLAGEFSAGPQSGFWKHIGAVAAEYGIPVPNANLATNPTAAQEEFDKLSTSVLAAQRQAMGLPVTDQSVSLTTGATPNERMTPKGIQRVLGVMEGNEDYINAERQAWQSWKDQGHGYETWAQFQPQFNRMFDPRVFQAQYMTGDEVGKIRATIPNYDAQVKVAKRLGYLAAAQ